MGFIENSQGRYFRTLQNPLILETSIMRNAYQKNIEIYPYFYWEFCRAFRPLFYCIYRGECRILTTNTFIYNSQSYPDNSCKINTVVSYKLICGTLGTWRFVC